ncbi:MAG: hypothetical protein VX127_15825, partial [Myxococcota bacterium]|nr:hypothetical protein [Myxococcota bacterium]
GILRDTEAGPPPYDMAEEPLEFGAVRPGTCEGCDIINDFNGWIDAFRISDVARYSSSFSPPTTLIADANAIGVWQFDETSGSIAADSSGNGNDAIVVSGQWRSACHAPSEIPTEALVCTIDEESTDADGDPITYTFAWDVDGEDYTDAEATTYEGDSVPSEVLEYDETWTCEVTASDGDLSASTAETHLRPPGVQPQLSTGAFGACFLNSSGRIQCWGDPTSSWPTGITSPSGRFVSMAKGLWDRHTCAIREDSTVHCWGADDYGQSSPPAGAFVSLSVNSNDSCGVTEMGTIKCWGRGGSRERSGTFQSVSTTSAYLVCGLRMDGSLECWNYGSTYYPAATSSFYPDGIYEQVAGGLSFSCGTTESSGTFCWSEMDTSDVWGPYIGDSIEFVELSVGYEQACGLQAHGEVLCWVNSPTSGDWHGTEFDPPGDAVFETLSVASHYGCALRNDNVIVCWGDSRMPFDVSDIPEL